MPDNPTRADLDRSFLPEDRKWEEEGTSVALYRDGAHHVCFGLRRKETDVVGYRPTRVDDVDRSVGSGDRDGSVQVDFRYVCLGYAMYGDGRGTGVAVGGESERKGGEEGAGVAGGYGEAKAGAAAYLPLCSGSEILLEKRAELHPQNHQHLQKKRGEDQKERGLIKPTPESSSTAGKVDDEDGFIVKESKSPSRPLLPIIRPGVGVGTIPVDEFAGRFLRSASLIAARVVTNMSKVAGAVKAGVDEIFYPDHGRSK
ncbi:hypothetical protein CBR_g17049 [Chara braunii]|uniref:Uncharacterized protein n=1 Tax=Chara braunii TaxID=69332 RepID=A0A388KUN1_CHABU|nr:hypothetical protein CBR_g17049 [Chara braunii]|eukprot:GBG73708.1 hypothetical protein CBR_g17049 [Chara braunii]